MAASLLAGRKSGGTPKLNKMRRNLPSCRSIKEYKPGMKISVSDQMGRFSGLPIKYTYYLTEPVGENYHPDFKPKFTPQEMLNMGVFGGKYLNDCMDEFPREWYETALAAGTLSPDCEDDCVNYFRVKSRKSIQYWVEKGWIPHKEAPDGTDRDARGWFQWYCRYYLGRRVEGVDEVQIKRWRLFGSRHGGQVKASYNKMDPGKVPKTVRDKLSHRPRQRQGLLQWSHDCFV